jgi:hypothetical protein
VKRYIPKFLKIYYLIIGLGYGIYLHGAKIFILLFLLSLNFALTKTYDIIGPKLFTLFTYFFYINKKFLGGYYAAGQKFFQKFLVGLP